MDDSTPPASIANSRTHSRNASYTRTPLARRPTRGPLDGIDDPSAPDSPSKTKATTIDPLNADAVNTAIPSTPFSPERGYSATSPTKSPPIVAFSHRPDEPDLSFLLRPSIYHALPPPLALSIPTPPPNPPNTTLSALLRTHNYRAASLHCADRLSHPPTTPSATPLSTSEILSLFYTRLATLVLLGYTSLAADESRILGDPNTDFYHHPSSTYTPGTSNILPWHLRSLVARLASLAHNDVRRGIAAFYELAREARRAALAATAPGRDEEERETWRARLRECGVNVANVLIEAGDMDGAARCLEGLRRRRQQQQRDEGAPAHETDMLLDSRLAMVYLSLGDIDAAKRHCHDFPPVSSSSSSHSPTSSTTISPTILPALLLIAEGDYPAAAALLESLPQSDLVVQNLAVCLFYMGRKDETVELLEGKLVGEKGRAFRALTFNLATCFELGGGDAVGRKVGLAERVVGGLRGRVEGGERDGAAFKL